MSDSPRHPERITQLPPAESDGGDFILIGGKRHSLDEIFVLPSLIPISSSDEKHTPFPLDSITLDSLPSLQRAAPDRVQSPAQRPCVVLDQATLRLQPLPDLSNARAVKCLSLDLLPEDVRVQQLPKLQDLSIDVTLPPLDNNNVAIARVETPTAPKDSPPFICSGARAIAVEADHTEDMQQAAAHRSTQRWDESQRLEAQHPAWLLLDLARLTSNRPCPPACSGHICLSPRHEGSRLVSCSEVGPRARCLSCIVDSWAAVETSGDVRWTATVADLQERDGRRAKLRLPGGVDDGLLPDPLTTAVAKGERVALSKSFQQPRFLPSMPRSISDSTSATLRAELLYAVQQPKPSMASPLFSYTDEHLLCDLQVAPRPLQLFLNFADRVAAMRVSVDLVDQLYINHSSGAISLAPFHAAQKLELVPNWFNLAKGGGFGLTSQYFLLAITLWQLGVGSEEDMDTITALIKIMEPVDRAYKKEAWVGGEPGQRSPWTTKGAADVVTLRKGLNDRLSVHASVPTSAQELHLQTTFAPPTLTSDTIHCGEKTKLLRLAQEATPERRKNLLRALNEMERWAQHQRPAFSFRRNDAGFPVIFWSHDTTTDALFLMAAACLIQAEICDHRKGLRPTSTVVTVVLFWAFCYFKHGDRDHLSGLRLDFGMTPNGSLVPTLLAHTVHGVLFHLGSVVPFPSSFAHFDAARLNGRVEAHWTNFSIRTLRLPTLCAVLRDFYPTARKLLGVCQRNGLLNGIELRADAVFNFNPETQEELWANGLSELELGRSGVSEYEGQVSLNDAAQLVAEAEALSEAQVRLLQAWRDSLPPLPGGDAANIREDHDGRVGRTLNEALQKGKKNPSKAHWNFIEG